MRHRTPRPSSLDTSGALAAPWAHALTRGAPVGSPRERTPSLDAGWFTLLVVMVGVSVSTVVLRSAVGLDGGQGGFGGTVVAQLRALFSASFDLAAAVAVLSAAFVSFAWCVAPMVCLRL